MRSLLGIVLGCVLLLGLAGCGGSSTPTPPPPPPPTLTIVPASATVPINQPQQFNAFLSSVGTPQVANWSVNGVAGGNATAGTINASGMYTSPAAFPTPNTVTVMAVLQADATKTANAGVTIAFPNDNAGNESVPIKLGTSGGNVLDKNTANTACCIGTLGSLINRGGTLLILSNNHVLARSTLGNAGEAIDQPGLAGCPQGSQGLTVANLTAQSKLAPAGTTVGRTGPAPDNADAAIAQIVPGTVDPLGNILDLGAAGGTSIAAAPPSSTLTTPAAVVMAGEHVAKSGRTTGLTCSTLSSASTDGIPVSYDQSCGGAVAFTVVFSGQVVVSGGNFSAGGDSGSLIVTTDNAQPVALLFAGSTVNTIGNPIQDVIKAFTQAGPPVVTPTMVGGPDHPVSCAPTTVAQSTQASAETVPLSVSQKQIAAAVRDRHAAALMASEQAIRSVKVGGSSDAPGEGALLIELSAVPRSRIPAVVEGVRTKLVYGEGVTVPSIMTSQEFDRGLSAKDAHRSEYLQPGFQGIGVGRSDDAPGETAIVIYTISGKSHAPIPAVIDGVRTKIIDDAPFRAFGWNSHLEPKTAGCVKPKTATPKK